MSIAPARRVRAAHGGQARALDAVDVVAPVGELLAVVDAHVAKLGHVEHVVGWETIGIDHRIGLDARPDDWDQYFRSGVWDSQGMDLAATLEQPEDRDLAASAAPRLPLRRPPK